VCLVVSSDSESPTPAKETSTPREQVLSALDSAGMPLSARQLRQRCRVRASTISEVLAELERAGEIQRSLLGWILDRQIKI